METSVKEQLSRLLQQPPGGGALSGLPVQLEEGVRNNRMDPAALQRLLNPSQEQKSSSPKDEEQIFLPLDTPVWHLPSGTGDGSLMVTRAENVEWMRMIWGKMDDPSAIVEMLAKQQKEKEEEEKSEADRARRQQEEQEHQKSDQQRLLTQVMSSLGSAAGAAQQQQRSHQSAAQPSTQDLLAQLLGGQDYSAVHKELEVSLGKQQVTDFPPPGPRHARKTSLESMSMFESMGSLMSPQQTSMSGGAAPSLLNLFDQPLPAAAVMSPVRAALTPGTLAPGTGPFYVVMADSRIQLTANGFNLSVASGPHGGFEEALASMAAVSHRRSMPRKDAQMVHVTSDTPIWHSLDLAHTSQPTMIVKACSLQGAPFKLDDDASAMPPPPSPGMGSLQQHLSLLGALNPSPRQSPVTLAPLPASSGPPEFSITSHTHQHSSKMPPPPAHILEMTTSYHHNPEPVHKAQEQQQGSSGSALPQDSAFGEPSEGSLKRPLGTSNSVPNKKAHILGRQDSPSAEGPGEAEEQPEALHGEEGNHEAEHDEAEAHQDAPDAHDDGVQDNGDEGQGNEDGAANEDAHGDDGAAEEASDVA